MKDALIEQYQAIRSTIRANVQTIGRLLEQAEMLKTVVAGIADTEAKLNLEKQIAEIETTISSLIHQTDELFDLYQQFVEKVFSHKQ